MSWKAVGIAILAVVLNACAGSEMASQYSGANGKTLIVAKEDWAKYQEYLSHASGTNPGTFIVSVIEDHTVGSGYTVCPAGHCRANTNVNRMMDECKASGMTCMIFAHSSSIVVNYKVEE